MATIIDGKQISQEIKDELRIEVDELFAKSGKRPVLTVILIGDNPASSVYVKNKIIGCSETGIVSREYKMESTITEEKLLSLIAELNADAEVNGILVQLPLPSHIDEKKVIYAIDPDKDVDGFHPVNVGKMMIGEKDTFFPCTPYGCQELISRAIPDTAGKHLVVVGRSNIVGKPMANIMVQKGKHANCIVTICHTGTNDIPYYTKQADILVAAVGVPEMIKADMVKDGVVVIDVGMNRIQDPANPEKTKLVGDVAFEEVSRKASAITPVPGGVGKMTIAMLLKNTVKAFRLQNGLK